MTITYSCTVASNTMPTGNGGSVRLSHVIYFLLYVTFMLDNRGFLYQPEFPSIPNNRIVPIQKQVYKGICVTYNCFLKAPFLSMTSKPCQDCIWRRGQKDLKPFSCFTNQTVNQTIIFPIFHQNTKY